MVHQKCASFGVWNNLPKHLKHKYTYYYLRLLYFTVRSFIRAVLSSIHREIINKLNSNNTQVTPLMKFKHPTHCLYLNLFFCSESSF